MMDISLEEICTSPSLDRARILYEKAFPDDERRSTDNWMEILENRPEAGGYCILYKGVFAGFITIWDLEDFSYIEYFAIEDSLRGLSIGGKILDKILGKIEKDVVLEVEPPTYDMAVRRIGFYRRHGLEVLSKDYIQPSYSPEKRPLPLFLMHKSGYKIDNIEKIITSIHKNVYGKQ